MPENAIFVKALRFDPSRESAGRFEEYRVETAQPLSVMALLAKIHDQDATFACRTSTCFKGRCGSCLVRVDGRDVFGCTALIYPGQSIVVEPHSQFKVIRDVAVDFAAPQAVAGDGVGAE
ncbi:MAG: 2Fe-2S iron-sulfur cluster-binding protein [Negativicutes bacterium]|nr:2Fe-2S iron-sulfur cluster-binding protein [Negativicutes bacterium]